MAWCQCIILMHYKFVKLPVVLENSPFEYMGNNNKTCHLS